MNFRIERPWWISWLVGLGLIVSPAAFAQGDQDEFLDTEGAAEATADEPSAGGSGGAVWAEEGDRVAYDDGAGGDFDSPAEEADMPQDRPPVEGEVDPSYFFEYLAPYGDWMWTAEYGWVWHPTGLDPDWRPYSYGRWVSTSYGWTWVAYEPWGWAAFHYGRWAWMEQVGWIWVPGTVWGPGWVMWRYSDDYIGWSPLLAGYDWWFGWAYYPVFYEHWVFVDWHHFCHHRAHHYYSSRHHARDHFRHTYFPRGCRDASSPTCQRGPAGRLVERRTGAPVQRFTVRNLGAEPRKVSSRELSKVGLHGDELTIFRPKPGKAPGAELRDGRPGMSRPRVIDFGTAPDTRLQRAPAAPAVAEEPDPFGRRPSPGANIEPNRPPKVSRDRPAGNRMPGNIVSGPGGIKPAAGNSRPGFAPGNSRPGFAPGNSRPGFAPGNSRPGFAPGNSRPGLAPGNSRPGFSPGHKPGFSPGHNRPAVKPSGGGSRDSGHRASSGGGGHKGSSGGGGSKGSSSGGGGNKRR